MTRSVSGKADEKPTPEEIRAQQAEQVARSEQTADRIASLIAGAFVVMFTVLPRAS
ncbi:MAG TPA: hypothetical protein VGX25_03965 [Actinophytocola sp.]|uniref:hypothetical protein n=1 Tax=Actinophytocola sp. TaxID=1872138 RepID=UPI002DDC9D2A|nr:hypothetical protein [Actinophytocola sp.]HEV2778534.1 hypothetical protein [Actinophytocola sp.]